MATDDDSGPIRIDPVPVSKLRETALSGEYDPGVNRLLTEELKYIRKKRENATRDNLAGLALSGGGIRSATFALGVMQALANAGVLSRMDYLSTVSGGGYIGSAVTWFLGPQNKQTEFGLEGSNFPWGIDAGGESSPLQRKMLDWLRQHGKYLTPGKGITLMSGVAVVLRGILLNLLVWIPLGVAVFLLLFALGNWFVDWLAESTLPHVRLLDLLASIPAVSLSLPAKGLVLAALFVSAFVLLVLAIGSVIYSLITWICVSPGHVRYGFRRLAEALASGGFWLALGGIVMASVPIVGTLFHGWVAAAGGPLSALAGIATGIGGFLRTLRTGGKAFGGLAAAVGAALLIYGLALVCFRLAVTLTTALPDAEIWSVFHWFLIVAIATGIFVNINYISIHLFYRDRLMEAFLPDAKAALAGRTGAAFAANRAKLDQILASPTPVAPYQIINANVVLVNAKNPRRRLRGGDSFILTPRYCGSSATGWTSTGSLIKGKFTLPTAMAISGAAANPNAGSDGVGVTRSRTVSLLMSLLNLRLGYWIPHPIRGPRWLSPNHFIPGLAQALGKRFGFHTEDAVFVELSDGGHFENLALYELIRRRLKLIIVCDGACDPKFGFGDLNSLRRRVAADFGASIRFDIDGKPDDLIPNRLKLSFPDNAGYATEGDMAKSGFIIGRIEYATGAEKKQSEAGQEAEAEGTGNDGKTAEPKSGVLVYIKTTMVESLSFGVKAYKGAHHDFPDQTTADQFFDEEQFDAYRELGRHLGLKMLKQTELADRIEQIIEDGTWPSEISGAPTSPP